MVATKVINGHRQLQPSQNNEKGVVAKGILSLGAELLQNEVGAKYWFLTYIEVSYERRREIPEHLSGTAQTQPQP